VQVAAEHVDVDRRPVRPVWFDACLVGVIAFAVFAATAQYHDPLNNDTHATAVAAWQLGHHGNATLTAFKGHLAWLYAVDGREVTNRLPGTIFWAAPFYSALGSSSYPPIYPGAIAAVVASAIVIGLAFALCCRVVPRRQAFAAALLLAFATGTWTVSAKELWTHGPAQVAVLVTLLCYSNRQWLAAGIPAGFAILIRPHLGVVAVVLGVAGAVRERSVRPLLISVGSAVGLWILVLYNHAVWGAWTVFGGYPDSGPASGHAVAEFGVGVVGTFVSPERGVLVMTPALLLLLPGCRAAWRVAPWWVRSAAGSGIAYVAVQIWVSRFSGGDGFYSYRTPLEGLTLCVPLLALAWREWTSTTRIRRTAFAGLAAASVALHAFGSVVNWVLGGPNHSPWKTYMPFDLARHIGGVQTTLWLCAAVVAIAAAAIFTWRAEGPASATNDQPAASGVMTA
jgi:alpha-1,2-mannosyltransferase